MSDCRGSTRILVIDDEEVIRRSFCFQLEDLGYQVLSAVNGRSGVELIEREQPDLVLTDLRMPEMDGLEVIRFVQEHSPDTPIIVISGAGRISDAVEALRLGADDYLLKPVNDLAMLHHAVEKSLEKARLVRENHAYQNRLEDLVRERTEALEQANLRMLNINERLRKVVETSSGMSGCFDVQEFCVRALHEFARNLDATKGSLYQIDDQGLRLCHELDTGASVPFLPFPLVEGSTLQQVIDSGQPLLVANPDKMEYLKPDRRDTGQKSTILIFLISGAESKPAGLLTLHGKNHGVFDQQDKEIGALLALYCSETLRAVRAFESLRVSDQRYRMLFDKTSDGIFLVDRLSGLFVDANDAALRLTERSLEDLEALITPDIIQENISEPLRALDESNPVLDLGVVTFNRPDESTRIARLNVLLLDTETVVGIARDITEEQLMEKQIRRIQKLDAVGQLTGGIAHDFNNILGIILGNITLLEQQLKGEEPALKRIQTIKKSSERAATLTKQLLGFSRKQAAQTSVININRVIDNMENLISRSVTPAVEIEHKFSAELWLTDIDPGDFEDALLNLVINARDAMPGGGSLLLETANCTLDAAYCTQHPDIAPGNYVELAVSDTGEGMSPEVQEGIFEPFFTTKAQGKGTGLGLAMVFGFAKRSNGHIKVYSELGYGTTFRLYLPRATGQDRLVSTADKKVDVLPKGAEIILAVDDEPDLLDIVKQSLQSLGYRVLTAEDGVQALRLLEKEADIKLLFSDVVMPGGMNGYELAVRAGRSRPDLKVLLTSGYTGKIAVDEHLVQFRENLLSKPYDLSTLAQKVRDLLGESTGDAANGEADSVVKAEEISSPTEIKWDASYSVGIQSIDNDHKQLLALFNQSKLLVSRDVAWEQIEKILDQVALHTRQHFGREEAVMAACEYPGLANHQQVHNLLIRQLEGLIDKSKYDPLGASELFDFLAAWWIDHISSMDLAMASYCKDKGVTM